METDVFSEWFVKFANLVKERPLLLLFDGHMSHVSIDVIKLALSERIFILKFPPHVTDVLQPLDVSCFGPLKRKWDTMLQERTNTFGSKCQMSKIDFISNVCSIWNQGMTKENIISGFKTTGNTDK